MSSTTETPETQGAADDRQQKELTDKVGATLTAQPKSTWSTWLSRFGLGKK
jgi:hypothetical protein